MTENQTSHEMNAWHQTIAYAPKIVKPEQPPLNPQYLKLVEPLDGAHFSYRKNSNHGVKLDIVCSKTTIKTI